jgi:hypothetical protein
MRYRVSFAGAVSPEGHLIPSPLRAISLNTLSLNALFSYLEFHLKTGEILGSKPSLVLDKA